MQLNVQVHTLSTCYVVLIAGILTYYPFFCVLEMCINILLFVYSRMSVHYKFKSAVEYDTLPVDGVHISLGDLKEAIIQQKRLGRGQPYDLQITNAETKEGKHIFKIMFLILFICLFNCLPNFCSLTLSCCEVPHNPFEPGALLPTCGSKWALD